MSRGGRVKWAKVLGNSPWSRVVSTLAVTCVSLVQVVQVCATVLPYKNLDQLIAEAEGIVMGTVRSIESAYDQHGEIYTFVTLDQLRVIHGDYNQEAFVLRLKGGEVNDDVLQVDGSPHFDLDERVILFLQGNGYTIVPLVGWTQGVFRVTVDSATTREVVSDHEGNQVFGIRGNTILKERRYSSETRIIGPDRAAAFSEAPDASAGSPDDNTSSEAVQSQRQPARPPQGAMSVQAFLDAVQAKIGQQAKQSSPIQSPRVMEFGQTGNNQDAAPQGAPQGTTSQGETQELVLPQPSPQR